MRGGVPATDGAGRRADQAAGCCDHGTLGPRPVVASRKYEARVHWMLLLGRERQTYSKTDPWSYKFIPHWLRDPSTRRERSMARQAWEAVTNAAASGVSPRPSAFCAWRMAETHLALSTPKEPNEPRTPNSGRRRHRVRRATSTLPKLGNTRAQASTHTRIGCMQLACHEGISLCRDTRPQRAGSRRFGSRDEAWTRVIRAAAACWPRTVLAYWQLILLNRMRRQG